MTQKITLLGDSIIDNINYVDPPGLCVLGHLQELQPDWHFEQRAVDGHTTIDVLQAQVSQHIDDPTVLSIGGNDLLKRIDILTEPAQISPLELLEELHREATAFAERHQSILKLLKSPALICTIYNPVFSKDASLAPLQDASEVAISIFNDVIQRNTKDAGHDLLELRGLFSEDSDYANPIEPSHKGGRKLADAIVTWITKQK